ncbi:hypothetical protein BDP27DRAFT_1308978 [Rhodocollybia butyracea]|uniref:NACHT domain-containing protein n=1 Tax=Rhodocollybia butyracea TaxID=206335 RepID=A0A9P5P2P2_9AGAR|nr:hypothetical protein BDP27DRAFT_1308978 [Rhodocollybia butyracea]
MTNRFSMWPRKIKNFKKGKTSHPTSQEDNEVTPTAEMYALKGGVAAAKILEQVAGIIPVPFLSEFVKVAINVLEVCEKATAIEKEVTQLQDRVLRLALLIMDKVGKNASSDLQSQVKDLQLMLNSIITDLNQLKQQKKLLLVFFNNLNKEAISKCVNRLNAALEQFDVGHKLRTEDLLRKIESGHATVVAALSRIENAIEKTIQPHNAPFPKQDMPPRRAFHGRKSVVKEIVTLLADEGTSRVCITGTGGMGKTSVALAVMENLADSDIFCADYRFWIPCVKATSLDLFLRILYTQLRITADSYDTLDPLINELNFTKDRRLLLLDNFETPCNANDSGVNDILIRLSELPHVALMVTMTSSFPPSDEIEWQNIPLLPLDLPAARETFTNLYPTADKGADLDNLLNAVGAIPIAITLMAVDGKNSKASPKYLLQEWKTAGTEMISLVDRRISLSLNQEVVKSNPDAFTLLAVLSMLPAGTTGNNLHWWASSLTSHLAAVKSLRTAGLLEQDDGDFEASHIFVRPTIEAYMSRQNRIPTKVYEQVHDACYKFVLDHKSTLDDAKFKDDLAALATEETNIQNLLMQVDTRGLRPNALNALIAFSYYQLCTKASTVVILHALEIAQAIDDARCIAEAHLTLGKILCRLDHYDAARPHFRDAHRLFKTLPDGADHWRMGECLMWLADASKMLPKSSVDIGSLVREAQTELSDDPNHPNQKFHLAHSREAFKVLREAQSIFEELRCRASTSKCVLLTARLHASFQEYEEALPLYRQSLVIAKNVGDGRLIHDALIGLVHALIVLSNHDEAHVIISECLPDVQAGGSPLKIGQILELLGYNYVAKENPENAQSAFERARVQYSNIGSTVMGGDGKQRCSGNLTKLNDGQTTTILSDLKKWPKTTTKITSTITTVSSI